MAGNPPAVWQVFHQQPFSPPSHGTSLRLNFSWEGGWVSYLTLIVAYKTHVSLGLVGAGSHLYILTPVQLIEPTGIS